MRGVLNHFVKLGVKGFRFDSFCEIDKSLYPYAVQNPGNERYYFTHGPKIDQYYQELFRGLPKNIYLMGEIDAANTSTDDFYQHTDKNHIFNSVYTNDFNEFNKASVGDEDEANPLDLPTLYDNISRFTKTRGTIAKLFECHDNQRPINRFVG
jgi:glycosidase